MTFAMTKRIAAAALGLAALAATTASAADSIGDFYKDKTVRVIVGSGAGGGYDIYGRLLARHMGRFLPGNPAFVVQNIPGAGSIPAANHVFNVGAQDGTVIGAIQRSTLFSQILGEPGPQYEVAKFNWLGSLASENGIVYTYGASKVKTFEDLTVHDTIFGSSGPNETEAFPSMLINMMGARIKLVGGYPSTTAIGLAIERGEVEGVSQSWSTLKNLHPEWISGKKVNLLVQMSPSKDPDLPHVPLIVDAIAKAPLRPGYTPALATELFQTMLAQKVMGRPYVLGPSVPADRVAALRKAFIDVQRDPEFLADAEKSKVEISGVSGDDIQTMVTRLAATPKATLDKLEEITKYKP